MADSEISMLPATDGVTDDTLIPVYQPGATEPAQHMKGKQFAEFAMKQVQEDLDELSEKVSQLSEDKSVSLPEIQSILTDIVVFLKAVPFDDTVASASDLDAIQSKIDALGSGDADEPEEPEQPDEPDTPDEPIETISATFSGGELVISGVTVNSATFSDGVLAVA